MNGVLWLCLAVGVHAIVSLVLATWIKLLERRIADQNALIRHAIARSGETALGLSSLSSRLAEITRGQR